MNLANIHSESPSITRTQIGRNGGATTEGSNVISHTNIYSASQPSGIRKKAAPIRHKSISSTYADRLHQIALDKSTDAELSQQQQHHQIPASANPAGSGLNWLTPQHSPEPSAFLQEPSHFQTYNTWSAPTPPRSDSGVPTLPADSAEEQQPACTTSAGFGFDPATSASEMSSLGFLLPSQYANGMPPADGNAGYNVDQNYSALRTQPASSAQSSYSQTISSSPSLYQSRPPPSSERRSGDLPPVSRPMYAHGGSRLPYESPVNHEYSMPSSQSIPSISGLAASPMTTSAGMVSPNVAAAQQHNSSRPGSMYDSQYYGQSYTQSQPPSQMYAPSHSPAYGQTPYGNGEGMPKAMNGDGAMRVVNQRPKPQCWEHGCNGRQFSTFSNLLRHQREKSGTAAKSYCPKCGAEFTRTTARNGHVAHDKCTKSRRQSEDRMP